MKRKQTFYLTFGGTISVACFAIISALCAEIRSGDLVSIGWLSLELIGAGVTGLTAFISFYKAYQYSQGK